MKWELKQLGDLVETLKGFAFKSEWFQKSGIPIVKVKDFTANSISENDLDYISSEKASELQKYALTSDDVIIQTVGSWASNPNSVVGKVICTPKNLDGALLNQNAVKLTSAESLNKRFLFYCLRSDDFKGYIIGTAQGAANQASITLEAIRKYTFQLPPLPTQQKIASILSAYDDLIENNLKRIRLLEEAAQHLYREWFVRFRFPGWEEVEVVDGLPVGWGKKKLNEILDLNYGKALKAEDRKVGAFPVFGSSGIVGSHNEALVKAPGIIVGRKGNVGSIFWSFEDFYPIDTVYFVSSKVSLYFLYFNLKTQNFINSDAAVPGLNRNSAYQLEATIPESAILEEFERIIKPFFRQKNTLENQNQKLKAARDILLPRLMNQTIEV